MGGEIWGDAKKVTLKGGGGEGCSKIMKQRGIVITLREM